MNHDEVVLGLKVIQAYSDWCNKKRILFNIILLKNDIFHNLFSSKSHTLANYLKLIGKSICKSMNLAATAYYECC